ncbi:MAG TPA: flagellar basal body P-ring formation chaperone FlgA, partial [Lacipirellulaceae bacterium]|nr:flagellar basal body P-ring formation chaperone FlgA [Lacipirellulaceae bacterium]
MNTRPRMTRLLPGLISVCLALLAAAGVAAELTLREQAVPTGSIVRLGDIAEITATDEREAAELAAIALAPAPAAGTRQHLSVAQLRDLLAANGVDLRTVQIRGAAAIVVEMAAEPLVAEPSTVPAPQLDQAAVIGHIEAALAQHLTASTGHDLWDIELVPDPKLLQLYWRHGPQLQVAGGKAPWAGRQYFTISAPGRPEGITAFAKIQRLEMAVVAVRAIAAGDLIRPTDVELRPLGGALPAKAARAADDVVGKEAAQAIREGSVVLVNQTRAPLLVRRGERVAVRARAAGIIVRTYGTAQQNGCLGDLVAVQHLDGKQ